MTARGQLEVKEFQRDYTDPAATQYRVNDSNGEACALVIVKIPLRDVNFEGNVIQVEKRGNNYWVYVNKGTRFLEVVPSEGDQLNSMEVDLTVADGDGVSVATYVLDIQITEQAPRSSFTLAAGFSPLGVMGPTLSAGFMFRNFTVEAGATYGLAKSKDVYIYNKGGELQDAYNYTALRGHLRLGYDIWAAPVFAVTPQLGAAFTSLKGSRLGDVALPADKTLYGATAISATVGARLMFAPSGRAKAFRLYVTPEYDVAVQKDKNFEALSAFDSKMKSWAEGLHLSLGLMFYF